jgi:hypothetical protein
MRDLVRLILMLAIAASTATLIGSAIAWWLEERRRLTRIAFRVLGGAPDGMIVAQGRASAAAFRLAAGKILVMRDGGAYALLYPLAKLQGAELMVDGQVVARVAEGEPRRMLERIPPQAEHVVLRLVFDDAGHPDFQLDLWVPIDAERRHRQPAPVVIQEARGWLTRAEAILRRRGPVAASLNPAPSPPAAAAERDDEAPPWDEFDLDDELDIAPEPLPQAPASPLAAVPPGDDPPSKRGDAGPQLRLF